MKTLLERIADMAACVGGNVEEVLLDAAKEIKRLQAKIETVEKQEPVATVDANDEGYWAEILPDRSVKVGDKLYAAPAPASVPKRITPEQAPAEIREYALEAAEGYVYRLRPR